jgi:hypothetical protein
VKPDSSPISSQAMLTRQADLLAGRAEPTTATDQIWLAEMNEILDAGGFIAVPTDLPDPMSRKDADRHLSLDDDEVAVKSMRRPARFDWYGRDGDYDGRVQDGTPFERRSRSLSHTTIGGKRRKLVRRLRLRDLPFPFAPPVVSADKPPVAAKPEEKSLQRIGRRRIRAVFDPNASDGDNDGKVQDNTQFERPARASAPKRTVALASKKPGGRPGGGGKPAPKMKREAIAPFRARGRRDDVGSPKEFASRIQELRQAVQNGLNPTAVSDFLRKHAPFGGHRSKADGPHPAMTRLIAELTKIAKDKHGPLNTPEELEAALKKAFPNADIGIGDTVAQFPDDYLTAPPTAKEQFAFVTPNMVGAVRRVGQLNQDTARQMLAKTQRSVALAMLGLAEQHPEVAERVGYVGLTIGPEKEGTAAFVTGDPRDHHRIAIAFDPAQMVREATYEPDAINLANRDRFFASIAAELYWPDPNDKEKWAELGATGTIGFVADSDLDSVVFGTAIHEWGHAAGMTILLDDVLPGLEAIGYDDLMFGNGPVDVSPAPWLKDLADSFVSERAEFQRQLNETSAKLARIPYDLLQRMKTQGIPEPGDWMKMKEPQRLAYAEEVIKQQMRSAVLSGILTGMSFGAGPVRTRDNKALRSLGTYGLSKHEEAAAEMYAAWKLGVRLEDIVSRFDDPDMYERLAL